MRNQCFTLTTVRPEQPELLKARHDAITANVEYERKFRIAFNRTTKQDGTIAQRREKAREMVEAGVIR